MISLPASTVALPTHPFALLARGVAYPWRAMLFMKQHKLWVHTGAIVGVNLILFAALALGTVWLVWPFLESLNDALLATAGESAWLRGILTVLTWLIWAASLVILVGLAGFVMLLVGQAVASPLLDALSEKVENIVLGNQPLPMSTTRMLTTVWMAMGDLLGGLVFIVVVQLPLLVAAITPLAAFAGALSAAATALALSHEFVGLSLARHMLNYRARWLVVWRNRWLCMGLGFSCAVMFAIPGINLVLLPIAAVAGTMAYCDLVLSGRVQLPRIQ